MRFQSAVSDKAVINVGGGLTINGDADSHLTIAYDAMNLDGAGIGSDKNDSTCSAGITINGGNFTIKELTGGAAHGAMIGSGRYASIGDIVINGGKFDLQTWGGGACIGSGESASAGDIHIEHTDIKARCDDGACIGSGATGASVGNIDIENAILSLNNSAHSSAYLSGYNSGSGAGIGSGYLNSTAGNISIRNTFLGISSNNGEAIGKGVSSTVGKVSIDNDYKPLVIHTGTKANQATHCYVNDMSLKTLGLEKTQITTQRKAQNAIEPIDKAISYALDEATTLGAYQNRLSFTEDNLVTASENTTAAESTIRDADMAGEMVGYTKSNILTQAAQSMLAQANQNASSILGLLQ